MSRVKFISNGGQKQFLKQVLEKTNSPSIRELANRLGINYSSLKNNFSGRRLLSENLFQDLCIIGNIPETKFKTELIKDNWGHIKGGKN